MAANVCAASSRILLHPGYHVLVSSHCEPGGGVPEALADDLDGHAGLEQQGGMGVPKVVDPDALESRAADELLERG